MLAVKSFDPISQNQARALLFTAAISAVILVVGLLAHFEVIEGVGSFSKSFSTPVMAIGGGILACSLIALAVRNRIKYIRYRDVKNDGAIQQYSWFEGYATNHASSANDSVHNGRSAAFNEVNTYTHGFTVLLSKAKLEDRVDGQTTKGEILLFLKDREAYRTQQPFDGWHFLLKRIDNNIFVKFNPSA